MSDFVSGYVAGAGANNNGGGNGWGGAWGENWIWILVVFALLFGWGGNGLGGGGRMGGGVQDGYVLASDMSRIQNTISQGLCDGFYSTAQLINGVNMQDATNTAAIQQTLTQGFAGLNTGMLQTGNAIQTQIAQCCCDEREAIAGVNYNMAMNANNVQRQIERGFCDVGYGMATNTTSIVQNAHNDADRILARIDKMESDRQAERIAQLQSDNSMLKSQIYHDGNVRWLYEKLGPSCPQAAYVVQPPQQVTFPTNCCGQVNYATSGGCGCAG